MQIKAKQLLLKYKDHTQEQKTETRFYLIASYVVMQFAKLHTQADTG